MAALDVQLQEKERAEQAQFDARLRSREHAAVAGLEAELQAQTVPVLKDGLRARGLPLKGRKADLVRRLARARVKDLVRRLARGGPREPEGRPARALLAAESVSLVHRHRLCCVCAKKWLQSTLDLSTTLTWPGHAPSAGSTRAARSHTETARAPGSITPSSCSAGT